MSIAVEAKGITFSYPDKDIIKNLSFSIEKGDFFCIIGTNGTGKSTLLKLILNRLPLSEGEITINGIPNTKFRDYSRIAYVSQKATDFNSDFPATVSELVKLGLYSEKGLFSFFSRKEADSRVNSALERVGMLEYKNKLIGNLSGGQQQRVFIAKALVSNPEIIFLDEPTVGIDAKAVDSICCLLGELNKSGLTIVMVTHDISSIMYHSNRVLILSDDGCCEITDSQAFAEKTIKSNFHHHNHIACGGHHHG